METKSLQVDSLSIAYRESPGEGPTALLVHGNSSSSASYQGQLKSPFGEKYHLVALDLPGHGKSSDANDPASVYTLPGYAHVVASAANQLGLEKAIFVGWSLGGHILLEASPQLPDAAGFMIFGTPPIAFPPAMGEAFLPHPAMAASFKEDLTDEEKDAYVAAFFKPGTTSLPDSFKADVRRTDGRARAVMGGSIQPDGYLDEVEIVATLTQPLAILHGQQEQLVNAEYIRGLSIPALWRGELQIIPEAGHAPHWEQPEQFNDLLEAFIRDCSQ